VGSGALRVQPSRQTGTRRTTLFLLSSLGIGGSESKFVKLAGGLAERGARVVLAYLGPPEHLLAQIDPRVTVIALQRRGKFSVRALRTLVATIRSHGVRTVIAVNLYPALYVALARLWIGKKRFRFFVSANTTDFVTGKQQRQMHMYGRILRQADLIIFGAQVQRQLWRERYGIGDRGRATAVLYNGVDTVRFAPRTAAPCSLGLNARYIIGTVGRLRLEKAQAHLVQATARLRALGFDVGSLIVGDGTERDVIRTEIEKFGLQEYVVLTGAASDVRPFLARMDIFVLPSIGVETFSNAALEAMATGVPVVSSAVGGMQELLAYGGGITYPAGDVERLSEVLAELLADADRRRELGEAAVRAATDHFGWDRTVDAFVALIGDDRADGAHALAPDAQTS
jgi:L-malate glycosyltransferase